MRVKEKTWRKGVNIKIFKYIYGQSVIAINLNLFGTIGKDDGKMFASHLATWLLKSSSVLSPSSFQPLK